MRYIGIIKLLVLCLTLLLLTGCIVNTVISETTSGNLENQENTEEPVKWSGLGMNFGIYPSDDWDAYFDTLLANGFTQLRMHLPDYADSEDLTASKAAVLRAVAKGFDVIWGVHASISGITADNWADFRQGILDAATWAQANGVYEFQIGNEEEQHLDGPTMTQAQLIINLKDVATDVQAIFTNGKISYTCLSHTISDWVTAGRGDIDIIASNIYWDDGGYWETNITNLIAGFGSDHTYITEFGLDYRGLDYYSEDEAVQATGIAEMIDYIKASGMTRAFFFCYTDPFCLPGFGARKDDGTYRLLWNKALLNTGPVKFATIPTKTTTVSLPGTIALIPRITRIAPNPASGSSLSSSNKVAIIGDQTTDVSSFVTRFYQTCLDRSINPAELYN